MAKLTWRLTMSILKVIVTITVTAPLNALNTLLQHLEFRHKKDTIYCLLIANIFILQVAFFTGCDFKENYKQINSETIIKEVQAKFDNDVMEKFELTPQEWVLNEWEKVGQRENAYAVIQCESRWDEYAINHNSNGTYDRGIYQINDVHNIPAECAFDYKCATEFAIELWEKQGWAPWVCSKNLGIK